MGNKLGCKSARRRSTIVTNRMYPTGATMLRTGGQASISDLVVAYRDARAKILQIQNEKDREVGLAALRLEATHLYKELVTTGRLPITDLAPLEEYVANLSGGEIPERVVAILDAQAKARAKQVLDSVVASAAAGTAKGALALILGIVAAVAGAAVETGEAVVAALIPLILGGGSVAYFIFRVGYVASQSASAATAAAWDGTWGWADTLGNAADTAMAEARQLQASIWSAATGAAWTYRPFTQKARTWARVLVGAGWALVIVGAALLVYGGFQAVDAWYQDVNNPQIVPPPPIIP